MTLIGSTSEIKQIYTDCDNGKSLYNNYNIRTDIVGFELPTYYVSGATKIMSGLTSGSTGVYIYEEDDEIDLGIVFTGDTDSFSAHSIDFKYSIYPYSNKLNIFSGTSIYDSETFLYSGFSGTNIINDSVSTNSLEGEYLIKGFYEFPFSTFVSDKLGLEYDTKNNGLIGDKLGIYDSLNDWYFIAIMKADKPSFDVTPDIEDISGYYLFETKTVEYDGQTLFTLTNTPTGAVMVNVNGLSLLPGDEFSVSSNTFTIDVDLITEDIVTVLYVVGSQLNTFKSEGIQVTGITSGTTASSTDKVFYNTTKSKYEYYLDNTPSELNPNIIVSVNGTKLSYGIEYYQSTSNSKRIIFEMELVVGDVIDVFYNSLNTYLGNITDTTPEIFWSIQNLPQTDDGIFTLEMTNGSDLDFTGITYSSTTSYVIDQLIYSDNLILTGSSYGDEYLYRVKNNKKYITISGDVINSVTYSDTQKIRINTNEMNSY